MWRNIGFLIFQFILPTIQVSLFCLAIGRDVKGMTMAVVNDDITSVSCTNHTYGCILGAKDNFMEEFDFNRYHVRNLSCRYLSFIDSETIKPVFYPSYEEAAESVIRGDHWGVMRFKNNFTDSLYERMFGMAELKVPDNETLDSSEVHVNLDMTNQQVGYTIQLLLSQAYQKFSQNLLDSCDLPGNLKN